MTTEGKVFSEDVDVTRLGAQDKKQLMDSILNFVENDNEQFLRRIRDRVDRVGIEIPSIEVRFENLSIEGDAYLGTRALPTLLNTTLNAVEFALGMIGLSPSKKRVVKILQEVSGIIRPSRLTLLLGPPASGKTTFLKALAGKADKDLRNEGRITYCGHEFHEFVPQRTSAYISQHDLHFGEMTVRETLDFAGRCMGVGTKYDMLVELSRRENEGGINPDPEIDAFMKATAMAGQKTSLNTDYVLKILGLDICSDTMVGDQMRRGISGGQQNVLQLDVIMPNAGEMLVGPAKAFFMDEISTGLDSSTTFQIIKFMREMVHVNEATAVISLLQPPPETFELFDDVMLLSDGRIAYQGPREYRQQDLQNMLGAAYSAVFFLGATNTTAVQGVVFIERSVFYREKAAGMYSELPYAFAQVVMETFYVLIQTLLYTLILYPMIGFQWTPEKFFFFYFFMFSSYTYFSLFGMMLVALTPGVQFASILKIFFFNLWNLFSGFLIPRPLIPIWWRWYYWCSPVAWTIYGTLTSQVGDRTEDVEVLGAGKIPINQFLKETFGFDHDFLIPVVFAHIGWIILFFFIFSYAMKMLNFQRR